MDDIAAVEQFFDGADVGQSACATTAQHESHTLTVMAFSNQSVNPISE